MEYADTSVSVRDFHTGHLSVAPAHWCHLEVLVYSSHWRDWTWGSAGCVSDVTGYCYCQ